MRDFSTRSREPEAVEMERSETSSLRRARRLAALAYSEFRGDVDSPAQTGLSVGLGALIGCLPLYGLHLPLCIAGAKAFRCSAATMYLTANLNNPWTAPVLLSFQLALGRWLSGKSWPENMLPSLNAGMIIETGKDILVGSVVMGVTFGLILGLVAALVALRSDLDASELRLIEDASRSYLDSGIHHWEFVRWKLRKDPVYLHLCNSEVLPVSGRLLDIGCGRGLLFALLLSGRGRDPQKALESPPQPRRPVLDLVGLEKNERLARIARSALGESVEVSARDAVTAPLPESDVVVLLDVLHYLEADEQKELLTRAAGALRSGGKMVIREADREMGARFKLTTWAERVRAICRGDFDQHFHYRSNQEWKGLLQDLGLVVADSPMWAGTPFANRLIVARRQLS